MSQTSDTNNQTSGRANLPTVDLEHEKDALERFFDAVRPHLSLIGLALLAGLLLYLAVIWMIKVRSDLEEGKWVTFNRQMGIFTQTTNTSSLKEVAEQFPDSAAGFWGLQVAGDYDLQMGIAKLGREREEGIKEIRKARDTFKKIVESDAPAKTPLLQQFSTLSLAYAHESLGEFAEAEAFYRQLADALPDTVLGQQAQQGLARVTDPALQVVYQRFIDWEDPTGIAPGPDAQPIPDISFPEVDSEQVNSGETKDQINEEGKEETKEEGEANSQASEQSEASQREDESQQQGDESQQQGDESQQQG